MFVGDIRLKTPSSGIFQNTPSGGLISGEEYLRPISYFDYSDGNIDANISVGSKTGTFTASRGASNPATYIDDNGVMQKTETSNIPRFTKYYYDGTGLNLDSEGKGVIIESQQTNYLVHSIFDTDAGSGQADGWGDDDDETNAPTLTLVDQTSLFNVGDVVNSQRTQLTFSDGSFYQYFSDNTAIGSFAQNDPATICFFIKGTIHAGMDFKIGFIEKDAAGASGTSHLSDDISSQISSTEWRLFSFTDTCADADCSRLRVRYITSGASSGNSIDIQIANAQLVKINRCTSFIPTTSSALTRNAEVLKYEISDNRSAPQEACIIKYRALFASNETDNNILLSSDIKARVIRFLNTTNKITIYPNLSGSGTCSIVDSAQTWTENESITLGYNFKHTSPYVEAFYNGATDGTPETSDDFEDNAWGTYFYVGCTSSGSSQADCVIHKVSFFDKILSNNQHNQGYLRNPNKIRT